ncbi:granzyme B-like isoform 2-T2 [Acanthopagrus schlegelii]
MMRALQKFLLFHALTCLGRNTLGSEIIHGQIAPRNQMLYMASVQTRGGHACGGSLISDNFVLTAAHCDDGRDVPVRVVLGTHDLRKTGTVRNIVQRCKHPDFRHRTAENDIMLLKLSQSVPDSETIQRIRLPSPNMNLQPNQMCHVAGWGKTEAGTDVDDLRVVDMEHSMDSATVILVVLWCATGSLLVLYLLQMNGVGTNAFPMSIQTCPSSFPGSTRFSVTMVVKCNNLIQSFASAYLHCI